MTAGELEIGTMSADEVRLALAWAADEGWNPGLSDAECFPAADPGGFLIGRIDGEPVSVVSLVQYGTYAFLGLYIVAPKWRGRGLGWRTWEAAMDLAPNGIVGLDGVVDQQANYARSGFRLAHRSIRYGGRPTTSAEGAAEVLTSTDLDLVAAYDRPCFGADRRGFLARWVAIPGGCAVGVRSGGGLAGFGVVRPCQEGFKVGPLFADDAPVAEAILGRLVAHAGPGATVFVDVPEPNTAAIALVQSLGLAPVFETARMYRGGDPGLPLARVFGITTFELG